ncbi:DUF4651 domain-containing protein [Streptococcus moroccensis]|uniref:DUF4651 domain-containing protein n=1 Tax=Streptococcus moroccensis TaxID=1451356 RepID=A0ABT9YSX0_9STRE|nr:DUF4651 domain-containing protein [Streptococcus moroccensis]MDQ0222855.1 hypothetical protein [Streptococcus moroccensis]
MKRQKHTKLAIVIAGLGLAALALGAKVYLDEEREAYLSQIVHEVRDFFATIGSIATVYIDQTQSDKVQTKGGVIMDDGKVYRFDYLAGEIFYEEEV